MIQRCAALNIYLLPRSFYLTGAAVTLNESPWRCCMSRHAKMSDFVPCDIQQDLWEEILQRHWTFLETEESIKKLEDRKKLEGNKQSIAFHFPQFK